MAKVTFNPLFPGMSGKFNGLVYSRNRYGYYVKEYTKPRNPKTESQSKVRNIWRFVNYKWQMLTIEQKLGWNDAAHDLNIRSKGGKGNLTGYAFFIQVNMNIINTNSPVRNDSPVFLREPQQLSKVGVIMITKPMHEDILIAFKPNLDMNNFLIVSATAPLSSLSMPAKSKFKQIGVIDKSWNPGKIPSSIMTMYKEKFGARIEAGMRIGFKFQVIENVTGQAGKAMFVIAKD